jgi:hypothetical protein
VQKHDLAGRGTFFCGNTVQPKQSRRAKETVAEIVALHADIDLDKVALPADEVRRRVAQLQVPPTWVVVSGHGFHLYWVLTEALDATPESIEHVERLLHQLADHVGGDPAVCEVARLMRVPGSHNTENGGHVEVQVISGPGCRHEIFDLEDWLDGAWSFIPRKGAASQDRNAFLPAPDGIGTMRSATSARCARRGGARKPTGSNLKGPAPSVAPLDWVNGVMPVNLNAPSGHVVLRPGGTRLRGKEPGAQMRG